LGDASQLLRLEIRPCLVPILAIELQGIVKRYKAIVGYFVLSDDEARDFLELAGIAADIWITENNYKTAQ
jgi:hypothetical protein